MMDLLLRLLGVLLVTTSTRSFAYNAPKLLSRRHYLSLLTIPVPAAAILPADSTQLPAGLLQARVTENLLVEPPYGLEVPDIFYPQWFQGTWKVASTTRSVQAPAGITLFGGNRTYSTAQDQVGTTLHYESRFLMYPNNQIIIADREFNVRSIARAAMGPSSVMDLPGVVTPNKLTATLLPTGATSVYTVDLITLRRRQEQPDQTHFDCSEVVREIVSTNGATRPVLKEIETASLYTLLDDSIRCQQRSASFLLPSQSDPVQYQKWQAARGRPVDVRYFDVVYTRR